MYKKIFFIFIFLNFSLLILPAAEDIISPAKEELLPQARQFPGGVYLTLDEVCRLALNNNFDIQLAQFDAQSKAEDLGVVESIYDTLISAEANLTDDQNKASSAFAGTKSETRNYNFGVSQKLPTGTTLGMDFANQRSWSNSAYVTTNPAYNSSVELSIKQELGRNFFGIEDRSNIKVTKIDIENAQYTSLDKIEGVLSEVSNVYWQVAQYRDVAAIRDDMLLKAEELYQANKQKILKGIIELPQLLASEANLKQKEIDLILAENKLQSYINELKLFLNLEDGDKLVLPKEELSLIIQPVKLSEALQTAFKYRRDYIKAKNEIIAKEITLVMEKNGLWPEINLEASVNRNGLSNHFSEA
ncbi:MAG: TolC family protein, partial [Candidatus Omnitrophota bacterium]